MPNLISSRIPKGAFAQQDNKTSLYWLGAAGILGNSRGTVFFVDPLLPEKRDGADLHLRITPPLTRADVLLADIVFYTHADEDHLNRETAVLLDRFSPVFVCTPYVAGRLRKWGIQSPIYTAAVGQTIAYKTLLATATPCDHAWEGGAPDRPGGRYLAGDCCGWKFRVEDGTAWLPGDTRLLPTHLSEPPVDILLLDFCANDWHFGPQSAAMLCNCNLSGRIIPIHYGSFQPDVSACDDFDYCSISALLDRPESLRVVSPGEEIIL